MDEGPGSKDGDGVLVVRSYAEQSDPLTVLPDDSRGEAGRIASSADGESQDFAHLKGRLKADAKALIAGVHAAALKPSAVRAQDLHEHVQWCACGLAFYVEAGGHTGIACLAGQMGAIR